jgi:hypothetical protein
LRSEAETEANAKLIAAAPELLYAAKATVAAFEDSHDVLGRDNDWIYDELGSMQATAYFAARAAIAKAQMP